MEKKSGLIELMELRQTAGLTQDQAGQILGLGGRRRRDSVSAWEHGTARPHTKRRSHFIVYLLDKLGLRRDARRFQRIWQSVMVEEWGWKRLTDQEWQNCFPSQSRVAPPLLEPECKSKWLYCHPANYWGQVWIGLMPHPDNWSVAHRYTVRWGPWLYEDEIRFVNHQPMALLHIKGNDGLSIPLFFRISPACYVSFGQGEPPTEEMIDIDHGWVRVE